MHEIKSLFGGLQKNPEDKDASCLYNLIAAAILFTTRSEKDGKNEDKRGYSCVDEQFFARKGIDGIVADHSWEQPRKAKDDSIDVYLRLELVDSEQGARVVVVDKEVQDTAVYDIHT